MVEQALAAGHGVTAFVRDPARLAVESAGLSIKVGDARNAADLNAALRGQDAVVSTLGSKKLRDDFVSASTEALIEAMRQTGVRRVLMMSSFVVTPNLELPGPMRMVRLLMRGVIADKSSGEALLRDSGLDWTIVYATRLQDGPKTGNCRVVGAHEKVSLSNRSVRTDVAEFLVRQVDDPASVHQSPLITSR